MIAAEDQRRNKNFVEERAHFKNAQKEANNERDAVEARYRHAHTWFREGNLEQGIAELEALAKQHPQSERAARSWLDAGRARERLDQPEGALLDYRRVLEAYPNSSCAEEAAARSVAIRVPPSDSRGRSQAWQLLVAAHRGTELEEVLRFRHAQSLETDAVVEAIVAYEELAKRFPLPTGRYADEALLRSATLRLEERDFQGAIATLKLLADYGGDAAFVGSYRRPAYAQALLLLGRIQRDELQLPEESRATFDELVLRFPDSRLVDDALWELVLTDYFEGKEACPSFRRLQEKAKFSRYARCGALVCGEGSSEDSVLQKCRGYLGQVPGTLKK